MLNKELFGGGGDAISKTYTHMFTTESKYGPIDTYDYTMKTISPNNIDGYSITSLSCSESSNTFIITIKDSTQYNIVYLGDFRSKSIVPMQYINTYSSGRLYQSSYNDYAYDVYRLFILATSKAQPIWISFDKPF